MDVTKYPIGIQSFSEIRENGYLYVDKTMYVHRLVSKGKYYFLSRPRRFGKSLLLSTVEAFFRGRRDLFEGLAIANEDHDWEPHPVLHLDLNVRMYEDRESLVSILDRHLQAWEREYGIADIADRPEDRFINVILRAHEQTGKQVVILVDEYDKPIVSALHDETLMKKYREQLASFYGVLKSLDAHIKFGMLTGVSRFSKVSVFSGINNLNDISLEPDYNAACGITDVELNHYFQSGLEEMAKANRETTKEIHRELKENYDGYHFAYGGEDVYNPFSLLNTFQNRRFSNYWFKTGTPSFLVKLLERTRFSIPKLDGCRCSEDLLSGSDVYLKDPVPLFFQTGYLTIKGYDRRFREYTLGFPNREVSEGFSKFLMTSYMDGRDRSDMVSDFVRDVEAGDAEAFMRRLQAFSADIPYDLIRGGSDNDATRRHEAHYQDVMYVVFKLMGFYTHTEYKTSDGRIDMVVETPDYVYVMEFKIDSSAEEALRQIDDKQYTLPFRSSGKQTVKIGASFSTSTRRLSDWIAVIDWPPSRSCDFPSSPIRPRPQDDNHDSPPPARSHNHITL